MLVLDGVVKQKVLLKDDSNAPPQVIEMQLSAHVDAVDSDSSSVAS